MTQNINTLDKLLTVRDGQYNLYTKKIFESYELILNKVLTIFFNKKCFVHWEVIERVPNSSGRFVNLIGSFSPVIGDKFFDDSTSEELVITEDNAKKFKKIVKLTIPIKLLENGTALQIVNYLIMLNEKQGNISHDEFVVFLENFDETEIDDILKVQQPEEEAEPVILTDEQIEQLKRFEHDGSKTKH